MAHLGDIFRRASFPGSRWVAKYFDFCEEVGKAVTLQTYLHPEIFPRSGSLRGLKRLTVEQRTEMLADKMLRTWSDNEPNRHEVEMLLKAGVNTEYIHPQAEGCTLLGWASRRGFAHCAEALLRHGADLTAKGANTFTPFQQAAWAGQPRILEILLNRGADLSVRTENGMTPLMLTVNGWGGGQDNRRRALALLLARGVSIEDKDDEGMTAMDHFRRNRWSFHSMGWKEYAWEPLLKLDAEIKARKTKEEATQRFMKAFRNMAQGGDAPDPKSLLRYIGEGADIECVDDFWGDTALGIAASYNKKEICETLLDAGANLFFRDKHGSTPFMSTASNGYEELMKTFIARGSDVNERDAKGETGIIQATRWGCRTAVVKIMLEHGAQVHVADNTGKTALDYCEAGKKDERYYGSRGHGRDVYTEMEHILLAGSHRRFLEEVTGESFATSGLEIMKKLVGTGANVNVKDAHGWTPLLWAAHQGDVETIRFLRDHGADIQATDAAGWNALMHAAYPGLHLEAARFLLDSGIFTDVTDNQQRKNALDWAQEALSEDGKVNGRPRSQAVDAFRALFDPVLSRQTIEQYETGLRGKSSGMRPLRLRPKSGEDPA